MPLPRIGGSFAPVITPDHLTKYREIAEEASPHIKDVMLSLCHMVEVFQETPASAMHGSPHPSGTGTIVPLEAAEVERIDAVVPWEHECDGIQKLFDTLPDGCRGTVTVEEELADGRVVNRVRARVVDESAKNLRDAAFHLLWMAKELARDREPLTSDRLGIADRQQGEQS